MFLSLRLYFAVLQRKHLLIFVPLPVCCAISAVHTMSLGSDFSHSA
jgi:hypothetical protein